MIQDVRGRLLIAALLLTASAAAVGEEAAPYLGRPVAEVIEEFRAAGQPIAWSTNLVTPDLRVTLEPEEAEPLAVVREILRPHGLSLRFESGVWLVVRAAATPAAEPDAPPPARPARPEIETITVAASRYEIARDVAGSRFQLDRRSIQTMPDLGEDPLRATQRLPGAAASGASARTHFRGGEQGEIGIILNGQRLFDPFHVRDYQNVFSAIDSRAIDGIEVYTGGFPVRYGDRMSGVVLMNSMEADRARHTELGLSVFNTSALTAGQHGDKRWLFSARRGNLDLVIDPQYGRPRYYDVFGEFAFDATDSTTIAVNALYADDVVTVALESDPSEEEQVTSTTRNAQFWVQLDSRWSDTLSMSTILSAVSYSNLREGSTSDTEKIVSAVRDERTVTQYGLRQDWNWRSSDAHVLQWGMSFQREEAEYDYRVAAAYFGLPALFEGQPESIARQQQASPAGGSYSAYVADRWKLSPSTIFEWGLRWDDQTYTGDQADAQLSPRLSLLHKLGERTDLRLSWGRYYQSQGVHELQIEDDVTRFWPAQRAEHLIAGLTHRPGESTQLRVELFRKHMDKVRPRFENLFDPLALIPEIQPDRVRLDPDSAEAVGLEVSFDWAAGPWDAWAAYTWSEATDRIAGIDQARSWDQRHAFQGGLGWSDERWDVNIAASVHSGWPTTDLDLIQSGTDGDGEPTFVAVPATRNALNHGTFVSIDFRLSRRFDVRRGQLTAFLEVVNLTNRRNECCVDWDLAEEPGDDSGLERGLDYWLPLVPAVGVLWEF